MSIRGYTAQCFRHYFDTHLLIWQAAIAPAQSKRTMQNMDIESAVALIGVTFAAILSSIGYYWRARIEAKKSARKVLYYLLEIRHAIKTSSIDPNAIYDKYIDDMLEEFSSRNMPLNRQDLEKIIGPLLRQHFLNITESISVKIDENIIAPYESALLDLAEINPILAYRLKGKEAYQELIRHFQNYSTALNTELFPELFSKFEHGKNALIDLSTSTNRDSIEEIHNLLSEDILQVSKSCGLIDYIKCKKALKSKLYQQHTIDVSELKTFIDQCITVLNAAALKQHAEQSAGQQDPRSS